MSSRLEAAIRALPAELEDEVADFVEFIVERHGVAPARYLKQDWAGALSHLKDQHPSGVDLAHDIAAEWVDGIDKELKR